MMHYLLHGFLQCFSVVPIFLLTSSFLCYNNKNGIGGDNRQGILEDKKMLSLNDRSTQI